MAPKVLHITNWYPNHWNSSEALFIKEQFDAVTPFGNHRLVHVQVLHKTGWPKISAGHYSENERYLILSGWCPHLRIVEVLTLLLLVFLRVQLYVSRAPFFTGKWDLVNIHITWPLLRFPWVVRQLYGPHLIVSEHWSAFHRNFDLPYGSKAQSRLAGMFRYARGIIVVSKALGSDIRTFTKNCIPKLFVVPNVVKSTVFQNSRAPQASKRFLMVASWAPIKRPFFAFAAFQEALKTHPDIELRIVGYGAQMEAMKQYVTTHHLQEKVIFLGKCSKTIIAQEMQHATAFIHASEYETFSVVCAEAISCGTPVIASNVGGIPEFIHARNGVLIENTAESWAVALSDFLSRPQTWNKPAISKEAHDMFSPSAIGSNLTTIYQSVIDSK